MLVSPIAKFHANDNIESRSARRGVWQVPMRRPGRKAGDKAIVILTGTAQKSREGEERGPIDEGSVVATAAEDPQREEGRVAAALAP